MKMAQPQELPTVPPQLTWELLHCLSTLPDPWPLAKITINSCGADRLPVAVRFPAGPRVRLKTVNPPKGNGLGQKKNGHRKPMGVQNGKTFLCRQVRSAPRGSPLCRPLKSRMPWTQWRMSATSNWVFLGVAGGPSNARQTRPRNQVTPLLFHVTQGLLVQRTVLMAKSCGIARQNWILHQDHRRTSAMHHGRVNKPESM